jgi:hypothetical protein
MQAALVRDGIGVHNWLLNRNQYGHPKSGVGQNNVDDYPSMSTGCQTA